MTRLAAVACLWLTLLAGPVWAVQPDEVLADPQLEQRARTLSAELRCLVCQNQSIDDSDADLARDLRLVVRERLTAGDSDDAVLDYVVARYGEFVLLRPRFSMRTALLWATPAMLLAIGAAALFAFSRRKAPAMAVLSQDEEKRLRSLLDRT